MVRVNLEEIEKKFDFNDLVFPCEFTLKVIGLDEDDFLDDILTSQVY